jgi:Tfp pilus assembly protein PilO
MKKFNLKLQFGKLNLSSKGGTMNRGKVKLRDFAKERYLRVAKAFPQVKKEHVEIYVMLTLTFSAMAFLGLFAISPTITTIVELNRKLDDNKLLYQALETKNANLHSLYNQYNELQSAWPVVNAAVPDTPQVAFVIGQVQQIAKQQNLRVTNVQTFPVELTKHNDDPQAQASFVLTLSVEGKTDDLQTFAQKLATFERMIRIESITLANDEKEVLTVRIRAYFTP